MRKLAAASALREQRGMKASRGDTEVFVFLLVPGLSMMSLASAIEPLRAVNSLVHGNAYEWRLTGSERGSVEAANGMRMATMDPEAAIVGADYVFACGGMRIQRSDEGRCLSILRQAARRGARVGALSTGTYMLARAGLIDRHKCTIHWENRAAFMEDFPQIECRNTLYEIDRDRLTCSGGTAAMDMVLHLIALRHGREMAIRAATQYQHDRIRDAGEQQRGDRIEVLAHLPAKLQAAIQLMEINIEEPLSIPEIAQSIGIGGRQLERLFERHTQVTPQRYYMGLRVRHARELLLYSDLSVIDVGVACGFGNSGHFATWYKRITGTSPTRERL